MKEVDWIAKTLRRWKPMFSCQMEGKMDLLIQRLELEANQSPGTRLKSIKVDISQSRSQILVFHPSGLVSIAVDH